MAGSRSWNNFDFGPYRLVCDCGLFRGNTLVYLPPKELGVLAALVRRQGIMATKDELLSEVWADQNASEESLTRCIHSLRKVLGDTDSTPVIETLHRRGYRCALPVTPVPGPAQPPLSPRFENIEQAHEYYQRGLTRMSFRHSGDMEQASRCFEQAIELDPDYKAAYIGLAEAIIVRTGLGWLRSKDSSGVLRQLRERVLAIDPNFAEALALAAFIRACFDWDWAGAEQDLARAEALQSSPSLAGFVRGYLAYCQLETASALKQFRAAVELAPYVPHYHEMLVHALLAEGDTAGALESARRAVEMMPSVNTVHSVYSIAARHARQHEIARSAAERAVQLSERELLPLIATAEAMWTADRTEEARRIQDEIRQIFAARLPMWSVTAELTLMLDGPDAALTSLESACAEECFLLPVMLANPGVLSLRDHPRFQAIEQRVFGQRRQGS